MKTYSAALAVSVGVFSITSAPRMSTPLSAALAIIVGTLLLTIGALISFAID